MVKQNLAPLMGRRDAAYESAYKLSQLDIFSLDNDKQAEICAALKEYIDSSIQDTETILNMLSSPDTVKRENNYLTKMTPHYSSINQNTVFKINF